MLRGGHQSSIINSEIALRATIWQQYRIGASPRSRVIGHDMASHQFWRCFLLKTGEKHRDKPRPGDPFIFHGGVNSILSIPSPLARWREGGPGREFVSDTRSLSLFREVTDHSETYPHLERISFRPTDDDHVSPNGIRPEGKARRAEKSSARAYAGRIENSRKLFSALA